MDAVTIQGPRKCESDLGNPVTFYLPNEIPKEELIGYKLQREAALGIALTVIRNGGHFIRVFGFPGTGKSVFTFDLANHLNHDFNVRCSMAYVKCDDLATKTVSTERIIKELKQNIDRASRNLPSIVTFDEIDSLTTPIAEAEARVARLTRWIRDYADNCPERTFAIGITNYPYKMDYSIFRRLGANVYFEPTSRDVISMIIRKLLKIRKCQEVSNMLCDRLEKSGFAFMGSDIIRACKFVKRFHKRLRNISTEQLCTDLIAYGGGVPKEFVDDYKDRYKALIQRSLEQMQWWAKIYKKERRRRLRK